MSHHQDLTLREQAAAVAGGDLDPADLLEATLGRIEERNGPFNAIVDTFPEESERMLAAAPPGPLHGVPIAVKDMFALRGARPATAARTSRSRPASPASTACCATPAP
jgi:amidase